MTSLRQNLGNNPCLLWLRIQKPVTWLLGPLFRRSRSIIQLELTYNCNLKCLNCDRGCRQAPSEDFLSLSQVDYFLKETIQAGIKWQAIRLLGGEPTLHPQISDIVDRLLSYVHNHSPETQLVLRTNGYGEETRKILHKLPEAVEIIDSSKSTSQQEFFPVNLAPQDSAVYRWTNFSNACHIPVDCGFALTPSGYYPCGVAGAIDRIFGLDLGRAELPDPEDDMFDQLAAFCRLCGHFRVAKDRIGHEVCSASWRAVLEAYHQNPPKLTSYNPQHDQD